MDLCLGVLRLGRELGKELGCKSIFWEAVDWEFETAAGDERCKGKESRLTYRWIADEK
jgi:hypothetical protein